MISHISENTKIAEVYKKLYEDWSEDARKAAYTKIGPKDYFIRKKKRDAEGNLTDEYEFVPKKGTGLAAVRGSINKRNRYNHADGADAGRTQHGISYLGNSGTTSMKVQHSLEYADELTYIVYLAQSNLSGHVTCPPNHCANCKGSCLGLSGHAAIDIITKLQQDGYDSKEIASILADDEKNADILKKSDIISARIAKTRAFKEDRDDFMTVLCHEIQNARAEAEQKGKHFSVRLNGTSDIDPDLFRFSDKFTSEDETLTNELAGKNILEIFPDVQFYDYTKNSNRALQYMNKYPNYYLVLSYNGSNWNDCEQYLGSGFNVAMVFKNTNVDRASSASSYDASMHDYNAKRKDKSLGAEETAPRHFDIPAKVNGYEVIDGNVHDVRYRDGKGGVIVGLGYRDPYWQRIKDNSNMSAIKEAIRDSFVMNPEKNGFCVTPENAQAKGLNVEWS